MIEWILSHELQLRSGSFVGVFLLMALWELVAARRRLTVAKGGRWIANLSVVALNTVLLRLLFPAAAVGGAWSAAERGWGLLNTIEFPFWLAVIVSVAILDFAIYAQHVVFHAMPILWRLHMVHHADLDLDVTSGARFHPIEILLSLLIKLAVVVAIGAPALGVFIFEVLLNATAMFNHGNVHLPEAVDRVARWFIVTPDMHRVHHSTERDECNSNFGFNVPWWDRMLGTYRAQPRRGHMGMVIGLEQFLEAKKQTLLWMMTLPFSGKTGGYSMRGRTS